MKHLAWALALSTSTVFLGTPRTAQACSCTAGTLSTGPIAPPDTLIFATFAFGGVETVVLEHEDEDGATISVETTPLAQSPGYLVARPERPLDLGTWIVHSSTHSNLATFEVVEQEVEAPEVPVVTYREPFAADHGDCGSSAYVRFDFEQPVAAIFAQIVDPDPNSAPLSFDIQGQTVHGFGTIRSQDGANLLFVGARACGGGDVNVPAGTSLKVRFAAMSADGRMSEWTEPKQVDVPSGCSVASVGTSTGSASWAAFVLAGLGLGRRRRMRD